MTRSQNLPNKLQGTCFCEVFDTCRNCSVLWLLKATQMLTVFFQQTCTTLCRLWPGLWAKCVRCSDKFSGTMPIFALAQSTGGSCFIRICLNRKIEIGLYAKCSQNFISIPAVLFFMINPKFAFLKDFSRSCLFRLCGTHLYKCLVPLELGQMSLGSQLGLS